MRKLKKGLKNKCFCAHKVDFLLFSFKIFEIVSSATEICNWYKKKHKISVKSRHYSHFDDNNKRTLSAKQAVYKAYLAYNYKHIWKTR